MHLKDIKVMWGLAKKHWRRFKYDVYWHRNHVKFYAKKISELAPYYTTYSTSLLLRYEPEEFPYDAEEAIAALHEVNNWIREDERKIINAKD